MAAPQSSGSSATTTTSLLWVYQPPALPPADTWTGSSSPVAPPTHTFMAHPIQTPAAVPLPTYPPLPRMALNSRSIPTIPAKFATIATSGEFVDFNGLLHALESEGMEETPVQIELGRTIGFPSPGNQRRDRSPPLSSGQGALLSTRTTCPPTSHSCQPTS